MAVDHERGAERCNEGQGHDFSGGLCTHCLCPATPHDVQRADNALAHYTALKNHFSTLFGRALTADQARFQAWQTYRKGA